MLKNLLEEIRKCRICVDNLPLGPRPVLQVSANAKIVIAGQAPGTRVHETGIPFNDPSGDRLRDWMGVSRDEFYDPDLFCIIPMGFCYPGKAGSGGDLPPRPECRKNWHDRLFSHLPRREFTLIIGQYAQAYHLGDLRKKNLTETVQAWRDYLPGAMTLPHPSPRNNIWLRKNPWFEADVIPELRMRIRSLLEQK